MSTPPLPPDDPQLRAVLRAWQPDAALPPGFQAGVWRRLEREEARAAVSATGWERLMGWFLQPRWASACLLALAVLGGASGFHASGDQAQRIAQGRYVAAVDPFQKVH